MPPHSSVSSPGALPPARLRTILRWLHIILGLILMCYVYSPFNAIAWFRWAVKILVVPVIVLSGIWLWKFAAVNRWLAKKR